MQGGILLNQPDEKDLPFAKQAQPSLRRDKRMALAGFLERGASIRDELRSSVSVVRGRSGTGGTMQDRATRIIMLVVAVLLAILVLQPYVNTYFTSAREPRPVAARGDLAEFERTTVQVFETVAPSVVQVV